MMGESSGSASGSSPDGAAGVWTQQHSNPGTDTEPSKPRSRAIRAPSPLQEHWPAPINYTTTGRNQHWEVNVQIYREDAQRYNTYSTVCGFSSFISASTLTC